MRGRILFWHDTWLNNRGLQVQFPRLFILSTEKEETFEQISAKKSNLRVWQLSFRRQLLVWEAEELQRLMGLLETFPMASSDCVDSCSWLANSSGQFSVSSLAWRGTVKTSTVLQRIGVLDASANIMCVFCQAEVESLDHVLMFCPPVWKCWSQMVRWRDQVWTIPGSIEGLLHWWSAGQSKHWVSTLWEIVPSVMLWWRRRTLRELWWWRRRRPGGGLLLGGGCFSVVFRRHGGGDASSVGSTLDVGCMLSLSTHCYTDLIRETVGIHGIAGCENEILKFIPGFPELRLGDLPSGILFGNLESPFSIMLHKMGQALPKSTAVVINSFEEIEPEINKDLKSKLSKFLNVGPFNPSNLTSSYSDEYGCIPWLDKQKPKSVAYIGSGTVAKLTSSEVVALTEALEATGSPFLWSSV
ncbi:hypothetical protein ACSBR2_025387 [Camellia fascicularis]